jgi:hypothetical protein
MTEDSYDKLYNKDSKVIGHLRKILSGNNLLFLGCSHNKDRTVGLLDMVGGTGEHYAILPMDGKAGDDAFEARRRIMAGELGMHCIWYPKGEYHYVEDILEYIYADITGQIKEIIHAMPEVSRVVEKPTPAQTGKGSATPEPDEKPLQKTERSEPISSLEPKTLDQTEKTAVAPVFDVKPPVKTELAEMAPKPIVKPLVKNEIYTMGRWKGKPLEWLILDVQPDKALLITKDCLMKAPYNEKDKSITWEKCSLRNNVLPKLYGQIFDEKEHSRVLQDYNKTPNNRWEITGGADTKDKLFLLSTDEATQYFPYDKARIAYLDGDAVWWWLRSPGYHSYLATYVVLDGTVNGNGNNVNWAGGAVRPAFWLHL